MGKAGRTNPDRAIHVKNSIRRNKVDRPNARRQNGLCTKEGQFPTGCANPLSSHKGSQVGPILCVKFTQQETNPVLTLSDSERHLHCLSSPTLPHGWLLDTSLEQFSTFFAILSEFSKVRREILPKESRQRRKRPCRNRILSMRSLSVGALLALTLAGCTFPPFFESCPLLDPAQYGCGPRVPYWEPSCGWPCCPPPRPYAPYGGPPVPMYAPVPMSAPAPMYAPPPNVTLTPVQPAVPPSQLPPT